MWSHIQRSKEQVSDAVQKIDIDICDENGKVWGAVLLHSPVEGTTDGIYQGLMILGISIILALIIVLALAILFSYFCRVTMKENISNFISLIFSGKSENNFCNKKRTK